MSAHKATQSTALSMEKFPPQTNYPSHALLIICAKVCLFHGVVLFGKRSSKGVPIVLFCIEMVYKDVLATFLESRYQGHGYSRCRKAEANGSYQRRVIWLLISLGLTGFMCWQIATFSKDYVESPIFTSIEEQKTPREIFPHVAICPMGVMQSIHPGLEGAATAPFLKGMSLVDFWTKGIIDMLNNNSVTEYPTVPLSMALQAYLYRGELEDISGAVPYENLTSTEEKTKAVVNFLGSLQLFIELVVLGATSFIGAVSRNLNELEALTQNKSELVEHFVESCKFTNTDCKHLLEAGNDSFIFYNKEMSPSKIPVRAGSGPNNGLTLVMRYRKKYPSDVSSPARGYLVYIRNPGETMMSAQVENTIPLGQHTSIIVQRSKTLRLPYESGGKCGRGTFWDTHTYEGLRNLFPTYNQDVCFVIYQSVYEDADCKCNKFTCTTPAEKLCMEKLRMEFFDADEFISMAQENCPPVCSEVTYQTNLISVPMDKQARQQHFLLETLKDNPNATLHDLNATQDHNASATALTFIAVYFRTSNTIVMKETLKYTPLDFVANMGGIIGLSIGMSLLTLLQWMELIFDLVLSTFRRKDKTKTAPDTAVEKKQMDSKNILAGTPSAAVYNHPTAFRR